MRLLARILFLVVLTLFPCGHIWTCAYAEDSKDVKNAINIDLIILIDSSTSMSKRGYGLLRLSIPKSLIEKFKSKTGSNINYNVGIASFEANLKKIKPLYSNAGTFNLDDLNQNNISGLGYTDFREPLEYALNEFSNRNSRTDSIKSVIVITDGRPQLTNDPLSEQELSDYFSDSALLSIRAEFEKNKIQLFIVALGDQAIDKKLWKSFLGNEDNYISIKKNTDIDGFLSKIFPKILGSGFVDSGKISNIPPPQKKVEAPTITHEIENLDNSIQFRQKLMATDSFWENSWFYISLFFILMVIFFCQKWKQAQNKWKQTQAELEKHQNYRYFKKDGEIIDDIHRKEKEIEDLKKINPAWREKLEIKEQISKMCNEGLEKVDEIFESVTDNFAEKKYGVSFVKTLMAIYGADFKSILNFVLKNHGKSPVKSQYIAECILERWRGEKQSLDEIIEEIYSIEGTIEKHNHLPLLRYIPKLSETSEDEIDIIINFICRSIYNVHTSSDEKREEDINEYLREFVNSFKHGDKKSEKAKAGVKFYSFLLNISEFLDITVFPKLDLPDMRDGLGSWKNVVERVKVISNNSFPKERLEIIKNIDEKLSTEKNIVDNLLLKSLVKKWLDKINIDSENEPAKLCLRPVPELSFKDNELRVQIQNIGKGPAFDIQLQIVNDRAGFIDQGKELNGFDIFPGEIKATTVFLNVGTTNSQQILGKYRDLTAVEKMERSCSFKVFSDDFKESDEQSVKSNPYKSDIPWLSQDDIFVGREKYIQQFKEIIFRNKKGGMVHIWGLRRVGKTSFINYFKEKDAIKIYFSCSLFERREQWDREEFFGVVLDEIFITLREEGYLEESDIQEPIESKVDNLYFYGCIKKIRTRLKGKKIIIFFDDSEVFDSGQEENSLFPDFKDILKIFKVIVADTSDKIGQFFIVFIGAQHILDKRLFSAETFSVGNIMELKLLDRNEIKKLAEKLQFDDISFEYLWRITGGHPSLTQLICHNVWTPYRTRKISIGMVKKIVEDVLTDPNKSGYFEYLNLYSVPKDTHITLEEIVKIVDPETLRFDSKKLTNQSRGVDLRYLKKYHIIRQCEENYFLRVCFFKLWLEGKSGNYV